MSIDYKNLLTDEQKKELLSGRISQFAAEAFQHELNLEVAKAASNDEGIENAEKALAILETAIEVHQAELAKLK